MPASGRVYLSSCLLLFPPTALCLAKSSLRRTLYSKRSALFLIVFCESKVVKSRFSPPICGRPTRAQHPDVHIWPPSILQKASKSAFFNGEVETRAMSRKAASCRQSPSDLQGLRMSSETTLADPASSRNCVRACGRLISMINPQPATFHRSTVSSCHAAAKSYGGVTLYCVTAYYQLPTVNCQLSTVNRKSHSTLDSNLPSSAHHLPVTYGKPALFEPLK